jgi:hypothetical protein
MTAYTLDEAYIHKIQAAVLKAIVEASLDPTGQASMLKSAEICSALTTVMAHMIATSDGAKTPAGIRELVDHYAKRLKARARCAREEFDRHGSPIPVVNPDRMQ